MRSIDYRSLMGLWTERDVTVALGQQDSTYNLECLKLTSTRISVMFISPIHSDGLFHAFFFWQTVRTLMTFHLGLQCLPKCLSADILGPISSTSLRRVFVLKTSYEVRTLKIGFHQTIELYELLTFCRIFKTTI